MNLSNIYRGSDWFEVLQTTDLGQTAVMTLRPGQATGADAESHERRQQIQESWWPKWRPTFAV